MGPAPLGQQSLTISGECWWNYIITYVLCFTNPCRPPYLNAHSVSVWVESGLFSNGQLKLGG
jgi:hypothetical protein